MGVLRPTTDQIRPVNPVLAGLVAGTWADDAVFIAEDVLPTIPTENASGTIVTLGQDVGGGDPTDDLRRTYKSGFHRHIGPRFGTTAYVVAEYGEEIPIDNEMVEDADDAIDLMAIESELPLRNLKIKQEVRAANTVFNSTNFPTGTTLAGPDVWSNALSDPIRVVDTAVNTLWPLINRGPNTMVFGFQAWRTALLNARILEFRPNSTDRNMLTQEQFGEMMRSLFGIERIFVGNAHYNTAPPNAAGTAVMAPIWGDNLWIGYLDPNARSTRTGNGRIAVSPTAAARIVRKELYSEEYDEPQTDCVVVRHRHKVVELVINSNAGYYVQNLT